MKLRTRNLSVLLLIIISAAFAYSAKSTAEELPKGSTGVLLSSDKSTGTILVDAKLNGEKVVMILDTGGSHSMFDASAFGLSAVQFQAARMNTRGLGLDAEVVWRTADFEIGNEA